MTIESAQVQVSTIPVPLAARGSTNGVRVNVYNAGTPSVYLGGGTAVSGSTGHLVAALGAVAMYVDQSETLYAVAASGTATVHVLMGGVDA